MPGFISHDHFNEQIAGEDILDDFLGFVVLDLDLCFFCYHDPEQVVRDAHGFKSFFQVILDTVFVTGVCVDHIPFFLVRLFSHTRELLIHSGTLI